MISEEISFSLLLCIIIITSEVRTQLSFVGLLCELLKLLKLRSCLLHARSESSSVEGHQTK